MKLPMKQTGKLTVCRPTVIGSIDDQSRHSFDQREHVKFVELGLFFYLEGVVTFNTPTFPHTDDAIQGIEMSKRTRVAERISWKPRASGSTSDVAALDC